LRVASASIGVGVGEERAEVVDGADKVVEVGATELLDLDLPVPRRGAKRGEQRLGVAASERPRTKGPRSSLAMAAKCCARSDGNGARGRIRRSDGGGQR
jgi:hypothetical protein